ncbi:hypothetical protein [Steroidobacter sp.]|uniref:hypothetical protein n=1 Tax=Steroidobacter sp. TaxID=1978227 RepID=UPI001A4A5395|nr:hypothetical protein [Steroidobacter sp.]MBL8267472.1 hypothetical protein [Steroidobacter sp.]
MRLPIMVACCAMSLTGCAVRMEGAENHKPIAVSATAAKKVVLGLDGSDVATQADSWSKMKEAFHEGCQEEAKTAGLQLAFQDGAARPAAEPGTLLALYVNDFRYVSTGMRLGIGIMSGNAFIDANTKFLDLQTGALWGERPYATKSSAMEGIGSAMTAKQAQAICKNMFDVVRGADGSAAKK